MATLRFAAPDFWHFPPFYSLQPIPETRERQLLQWASLVLSVCEANGIARITPVTFPYFRNDSIGRHLSVEAITVLVDHMISHGQASWEDEQQTGLLVFWRSPTSLGEDIYKAVHSIGGIGSVYTIYELHSGDDFIDESFFGLDAALIRRALEVLSSNNKCILIPGSIPDDDGVKFV